MDVSPELLDEMAAEYRAGLSLRQIAARHQISHHTVSRRLKAHGVDLRNRFRLPPDELARLRRAVGIKEGPDAA